MKNVSFSYSFIIGLSNCREFFFKTDLVCNYYLTVFTFLLWLGENGLQLSEAEK